MPINKKKAGIVHIPSGLTPYPEKHEITAADILARHFVTDVFFMPHTLYKTADFSIDDLPWELKSPTGDGKYTIQHALQAALKQSPNIVFDARRSSMNQRKIRHELQIKYSRIHKLKRLILITKAGQAIELIK
jgi:hypothetical protein